MPKIQWLKPLKILLLFISVFHLVFGLGLMFSVEFQKLAAAIYGVQVSWSTQYIFFARILGSFVFILGSLALGAARDPLKHPLIVFCFAEFFILRDLNRHLFADEVYQSLGISPATNTLTSIFFGIQAILLVALFFLAKKQSPS
jgi:hypothetical protein